MSKKKKILGLALAFMLTLIVSVTLVSFSLAGDTVKTGNPYGASTDQVDRKNVLSSAGEMADKLTNIDHIIDKANNTALSDDERVFRIVQIVSNGQEETSLKKYVENGSFRQHVINNNRSDGHEEMPATFTGSDGTEIDTIQVNVLTVAEMEAMVNAATKNYEAVSMADLIYIYNDPANPFALGEIGTDNAGNDIPEDILKIIQPYALGSNKPLIIDYSVGGGADSKNPFSMESLATNVLSANYIKYRTFKWKTGVTLENFLNRTDSVYIPLEIADENYTTAKVLVINGDDGTTTMANAISGDKATFLANAFYKKGYIPTDVVVETKSYTTITDATFADGYDFVFIEDDTYDSMNEAKYNAIAAVSYAKKHVIYAAALEAAKTDGGDGTFNNKTNYQELLDLVAYETGVARQNNIYLSTSTLFDTMLANPAGTQEAANEIAALLKGSTYREFGGDSASGKKFTVLEIQPGYPIDLDLAQENDAYYTQPDQVYSGSKESVPEGQEYYAFEITMEKLVALTGLDATQIELVQVSTEELQGMKDSIRDKYDLVYIGGNTSSMSTVDNYKINASTTASQWTGKGLTFFGMYSHSGVPIRNFDNNYYGTEGSNYVASGGNDLTVANLNNLKAFVDAGMPVIISDDVTDAYTAIGAKAELFENPYKNQNIDPDSNMMKFLQYALEQLDGDEVDPDGNPIVPSYNLVNKAANVIAGFDKDDVIAVGNLDKFYGNTLTDYAVIFNDGATVPYKVLENGEWVDYEGDTNPSADDAASTPAMQARALLNTTNTRPTMNLTEMPTIYVANTPSSYLQSPKLPFTFELLANGNTAIESFTVTLYLDDNSNGLFTDSGEDVYTMTVEPDPETGKCEGSFTYEMDDPAFYGPVSWKIEAVGNIASGKSVIAGPSISYSAVSKVVRTTEEKELVHILQIIPCGDTNQSTSTLYFCTECQLANTICKYNIHFDSSSSATDGLQFVNSLYQNYKVRNPMPTLPVTEGVDLTDYNNIGKGYSYGIGLHEHEFGIWKYDSTIKYDDWNSNLVDALMGEDGDFEFEIDLFDPDEVHALNEKYSNNEVAVLQNALEELKANDADDDEIKAAKKALKAKQDEILEQAEAAYTEYNQLVRVRQYYEEDLRILLQYLVDNQETLGAKFANNGVKDYGAFAEVLETEDYNELFSNNRTTWRDNDPTKAHNFARFSWVSSEADDKVLVFEGTNQYAPSGEENKIYKLGVSGTLTQVVQRNPYKILTVNEYLEAGGSLDILDYEKYQYVYDSAVAEDYSFTGYYYSRYANAKSEELLALKKYWDLKRSAYGKEWMQEIYGMVLVGAAENFNDEDLTTEVCTTLKAYEKDGGNILMFHDTMTRSQNSGAVNLTNSLSEVFGLDRFHMEADSADSSKYVVKKGYDPEKYFLSVLDYNNIGNYRTFAPESITEALRGIASVFATFYGGRFQGAQVSLPYEYAAVNVQTMVFWMRDCQTYQTNMASGNYGSNRATQLNRGIITSYPFTISSELNISGTHNQFLNLDVEDDEVITWYTLAGSANKPEGSSVYAASPGDAADNYFIYSKGNVSYCGAGHAKVTGPLTDNNDERMLFINIICNSARKNAIKPNIKIYDPDSKKVVPSAKNKYILMDGTGEAYIEVGSQTEDIKFGFLPTTATEGIKRLSLYFQYENVDTGATVQEYITFPQEDGKTYLTGLTSGNEYYVNTKDQTKNKILDSIKLKPEYFNGYDDCAYIYIEVIDENDEVLLEKIRIDLVRDLFDLT